MNNESLNVCACPVKPGGIIPCTFVDMQPYCCACKLPIIRQHTASPDVVERVAEAIKNTAEIDTGYYLGDYPYIENSEECAKAALQAMGGVPVKPDEETHGSAPLDAENDYPSQQGDACIVESPPASPSEICLKMPPVVLEDIIRGALEDIGGDDCQHPIRCSEAIMKTLAVCTPVPVSVSLEKCVIALQNVRGISTGTNLYGAAKAVLESLKQQGVQFNVD